MKGKCRLSVELDPEEAMWPVTDKATSIGLPSPFRTYILPLCTIDGRYGATGFNICLAEFFVFLDPILFKPPHSSIVE